MIRLGILIVLTFAAFAVNGEQVDLTQYLLPVQHPAELFLKKVFSDPDLLQGRSKLLEAGFQLTEHQGANSITLTHPEIKGYVVKLVTDQFPIEREWEGFITRIEGERLVRKCVKKNKWESTFKVPKQWIFILPHPLGKRRTILIAENADLLPHYYSAKWYKEKISRGTLEKIFKLTKELGLQDCCRKTNLPRTKDGRLAVVDTETIHSWPVEYDRLLNSLNPKMQKVWNEILKKNP